MALQWGQTAYCTVHNNLNIAETDGTIFDELQELQYDDINIDWHVLKYSDITMAWHVLTTFDKTTAWHILTLDEVTLAWHVMLLYMKTISWHILTSLQIDIEWNIFKEDVNEITRYFTGPKDYDYVVKPIKYTVEILAPGDIQQLADDDLETFFMPEIDYGPFDVRSLQYTFESGVKSWLHPSSID